MKTAMQQLIYFMENGGAGSDNPFELKRYAKLLLEIEKEQLMNAFFEGLNDGAFKERYDDYKFRTPEQYYNETFNK
jgi:hypothetical protein